MLLGGGKTRVTRRYTTPQHYQGQASRGLVTAMRRQGRQNGHVPTCSTCNLFCAIKLSKTCFGRFVPPNHGLGIRAAKKIMVSSVEVDPATRRERHLDRSIYHRNGWFGPLDLDLQLRLDSTNLWNSESDACPVVRFVPKPFSRLPATVCRVLGHRRPYQILFPFMPFTSSNGYM
jgi:hypothetical protein